MIKAVLAILVILFVSQASSATTGFSTISSNLLGTTQALLTKGTTATTATTATSTTLASPTVLGGLVDATFAEKCLTKILENGLYKLPMITSAASPIGYNSLKSQTTAGVSYQFDYSGQGYVARIRGTCQAWNNSITLDEASYTKV